VTALFDFEEAHFGDPAEDLAWVGIYGPAAPATVAMLRAYTGEEKAPELFCRLEFWSLVHALETLAWADQAGDRHFAQVARERCLDLTLVAEGAR
jgi:aminoglycoside phosphotransferase (APT) family kinase protein